MTTTRNTERPTLKGVLRPLLNVLGHLAREVREGRSGHGELNALRELLETLPFSTEEFSLATNRLANAHRYVKAREVGAAKWELNALRQQLLKQAEVREQTYRL